MTRPKGLRLRSDLYDKITGLLMENPAGLNPYEIGQLLDENDKTVRTYLKDMLKDKRLVTTANPNRPKSKGKYRVYHVNPDAAEMVPKRKDVIEV